jgi:hypothetical protein
MDRAKREAMLAVVRALIKRPASRVFVDPVVPGDDCPSDYLDVISDPTSLREIATKLEKGEYASLSDCRKEIERCWTNAERYNGVDHPVGQMAASLRARFEKLYRVISVTTVPGFCKEVSRLKSRLGDLINRNPWGTTGEAVPEVERISVGDLPSAAELQGLVIASDLITDRKVHEEIRATIESHQPELLNGESMVVTTGLRPATFRALRACVAMELARHGLEFPA